jgi:hypothetical protein
MKKELRQKLEKVVRQIVASKVHGVHEDMTMDDTFENYLLDDPDLSDIDEDDRIDIMEEARKGKDGYVEEFHFENLIEAITNSFMNRFKNE